MLLGTLVRPCFVPESTRGAGWGRFQETAYLFPGRPGARRVDPVVQRTHLETSRRLACPGTGARGSQPGALTSCGFSTNVRERSYAGAPRRGIAEHAAVNDPGGMTSSQSLFFASLLSLAIGACTSTPSPVCTPACRAGFSCVRNVCVSDCNPPCGPGQACSGYGAAALCIAGDVTATDASDSLDTPGPTDAISRDAQDDLPDGLDAVADVVDAAAVDAALLDVRATDAVNPDAFDAAADAGPPCGHAGEPCCYTTFCQPGFLCAAGSCQAIVRSTGECTRSSDCAAGQACIGPTTCGDHGCFQCAASSGSTPFAGACTVAAECASGVCRGQRCTVACDLGPTADADCASHHMGYQCTQLLYRTGTAPSTTLVALGVCRQSCERNADCTAPEVCLPQLNDATNTMDFICGVSSVTRTAGSTCASGSECQSFLCVPGVGDGGAGACTAPCLTSMDCPAAAARCVDITWSRPDGGGQPGHGCLP